MVEQQATGTRVWMVCAPHLKDLGKKGAEVPLGVDHLPFLKQDTDRLISFGEEDHNSLFGSAS